MDQPNPKTTESRKNIGDEEIQVEVEKSEQHNELSHQSSRTDIYTAIKPSRYINTSEDKPTTFFEIMSELLSILLVIIFFPISIYICYVTLKEYNRAVIFRLGRLKKGGANGPGLVWTLPCIDKYMIIDLRTAVIMVPSQDVITKDSVTIRVDAVLYFSIYNPMDAIIQVSDVSHATKLIAQTTLRNVVGAWALHELLASRKMLSQEIEKIVDTTTEPWGVKIERVEIKDISLPESLQRSLASEAEAQREARAKIISAEGELNASIALKEASDVMFTNQIALQLRHLQILTSIASERNCTIIFPFPIEMLTPFLGDSFRKKGGDGTHQDGSEHEESTATQVDSAQQVETAQPIIIYPNNLNMDDDDNDDNVDNDDNDPSLKKTQTYSSDAS